MRPSTGRGLWSWETPPLRGIAFNYGKQKWRERTSLMVLDGKLCQARPHSCVTLGKSLHLSEPVSSPESGA